MEEAQTKQRGRRQTTIGTVVSNKMDKTVVVAVANTVVHRLYHRYMNRTTRFAAHDENNECLIGDRVLLVATRPLSKHKRWRVREILERGEER